MNKHQKLYDLKEEVYFVSNKDNEEAYLNAVQALVDFIYENFQEEDTLNPEYYSHKFEIELAKSLPVLVCVFDFPPGNKILKKSEKLKHFIINIALDPKYKNGRADFLKEIANLWIKDFIKLALNEALWCSKLMNIEMLSALNKKRIGGFSQKAKNILEKEENPKSELAQIATKYLKNEPKFKHYSEK